MNEQQSIQELGRGVLALDLDCARVQRAWEQMCGNIEPEDRECRRHSPASFLTSEPCCTTEESQANKSEVAGYGSVSVHQKIKTMGTPEADRQTNPHIIPAHNQYESPIVLGQGGTFGMMSGLLQTPPANFLQNVVKPEEAHFPSLGLSPFIFFPSMHTMSMEPFPMGENYLVPVSTVSGPPFVNSIACSQAMSMSEGTQTKDKNKQSNYRGQLAPASHAFSVDYPSPDLSAVKGSEGGFGFLLPDSLKRLSVPSAQHDVSTDTCNENLPDQKRIASMASINMVSCKKRSNCHAVASFESRPHSNTSEDASSLQRTMQDDGNQAEPWKGRFRTRKQSLQRYLEKKARRLQTKKIRYELRKINADRRPRIKGRFAKKEQVEEYLKNQQSGVRC